jgi:amino acid transporter
MAATDHDPPIKPQLGLWDAVSIIIGIVIGSSIYVIPSIINGHLSSPAEVLGIWVLGGVLCLIGALCYAELATAYPRMGGDYVYLTRAFGPWFGFQFGWAQLAVILTSSIGMMGFVFGQYAVKLFGIAEEGAALATVGFAIIAIALLSLINIMGVVLGKVTQNILTITKIVGLGGIIFAGFFWGQTTDSTWAAHAASEKIPSFGTALILVLYAYGGWNDAAFVAADMRERRHIPTTLLLGTGGVMVIYLLINAAYIHGLGFQNTQGFNPTPIAARVLGLGGDWAAKAISVLVMISALGAMNGLLFAGSRVCTALGTEHRAFAELGRWNRSLGSPLWSLFALAAISIAMVLAVGTKMGRDAIDQGLGAVKLGPMPWDKYFGGFDTLFAGTAPIFWLFFLFTGLALFVLRENDKETERPFLVPGYPYIPSIFCAMCIFGLYSALKYAELVSLIGIVPLLLGVPLYFWSARRPIIREDIATDTAAGLVHGDPTDDRIQPAPGTVPAAPGTSSE